MVPMSSFIFQFAQQKSNYFLNAKGQDCQKTTSIKEKSTQDITSRKLSVCLK